MKVALRHANDGSRHRKQRAQRAVIAGVAPNTPNRKCIHQNAETVPGCVIYYHVTKGWRVRRIVDVSLAPFWATIKRAQKFARENPS